MEVLMPFLLIFILGGFFLYNPVRRKYSGVVGVVSSYFIATGLLLLAGIIGAIFIPSMRSSAGDDVMSAIIMIIIAVVAVLYLIFIMITRCRTVLQRIMLPFAVLIIAFGFATRLMAAIFLHWPMENGKSDADADATATFPEYIYDHDENPWQLISVGGDNANYYCQKTGETRMFYISDFEYGAPTGFHRR